MKLLLILLAAAPLFPQAPRSEELEKDSAVYLQRQLQVWTEEDARGYLGAPLRHRQAYTAQKTVSGDIYAYADPTGLHRAFELVFDAKTRKMRAVIIYPRKMAWAECRKLWGDHVTTVKNPDGSRFYSYTERRLDVLVDKEGNVINLCVY
jgi:hypothetical protein